jgi:hypothetical protein
MWGRDMQREREREGEEASERERERERERWGGRGGKRVQWSLSSF